MKKEKKNNMAKRTKKVSINLTEEEYQLLEKLALHERRSISELAALIVVDNALLLYGEMQPRGRLSQTIFYSPTKDSRSVEDIIRESI